MALGNATFTDAAGSVSDLFAASADRTKASGDRIEATNYDLASDLATQNEKFAETSTAIKEAQLNRNIYQTTGGTQADIASAGFSESGSALDILRDSAQQGALTKAVTQQQGLITEAGYTEQAQSYTNMSAAATMAANAEDNAAMGADITAGIKAVAGVASIALAPATGGASLAIGGLFMGGGSPTGL